MRPNRALAPAAALLAAVLASLSFGARGACGATRESGHGTHRWRGWSAGVAFGPGLTGFSRQLSDELARQGWGDDTKDTVLFGLPYHGEPFPKSAKVGGGAFRAWVARALPGRQALRIEYSNLYYGEVDGNRRGAGGPVIEAEVHSLGLLWCHGRRLLFGVGPSLDATAVSNWYEVKHVTWAPGLTAFARLELYRKGTASAGLAAGEHFGAPFDVGPLVAGYQGETFAARDFRSGGPWIGVSIEASMPGDEPE